MVKTIYIDTLFFINFIINYLILFATAKIGAARIKRIRLLLAALLGALYGVAVFFPHIPFATSFATKIVFSIIMVLCAFGRNSLFRMVLLFLGVSLAFGGIVFAISLVGGVGFAEIKNGIYYINISSSTLLFSSGVAYLLLRVIFSRSASRADRKLCRVYIRHGDTSINLCALHDTGNSLRDPSTNAPIVISDYDTLREIFPQKARCILDIMPRSSFPLALDKLSICKGFKLIPYKSVGTDFALMLTFRPDEISFDGKTQKDALIAISAYKISDGGAYSALI